MMGLKGPPCSLALSMCLWGVVTGGGENEEGGDGDEGELWETALRFRK